MIPRWLISVLAHAPSSVLVLGSICLLLMLCIAAGLATHFLLENFHVVLAVLRTAADLLCMGASAIAAAVAASIHKQGQPAPLPQRKRKSPLGHPETTAGSGEAAKTGDFPAWRRELLEAGIDPGQIVREER